MPLQDGKFKIGEISIGAWNVHGIWCKINSFRYNIINDSNVLDVLQKYKIFCLIETHHVASESDLLHIPNYKCFDLCRKKDPNKRRFKASGGLAAYVHDSLRPGVTKMPESGTEAIILKLKKEFFGLSRDIYICFAYCVPASSNVLNNPSMPDDIYDDLGDKLAKYAPMGDLILLGDLNARTQNLLDYIPNESFDYLPINDELYSLDTIGTFPRNNMDSGSNSYGGRLLELCKKVPLRILNGRMFGDLFGNLTCYTPLGSSCVDYCAASPELLKKIRYFQVKPLMPIFSDHTPITLCLKVNANISVHKVNYDYLPKPDKIQWDKTLAEKFMFNIQSPDCKEAVRGFMNTGILPDQNSVENATKFITDILVESAIKAEMPIKKGVLPRRQAKNESYFKTFKPKHPKWHDQSCFESFRSMKKTSLLLNKDPKNSWLRGKLMSETKEYKRLVKFKQKQFTNNLFNELELMQSKDPRAYMELVKALRDGKHDRSKPSDLQEIEPDTWFEHFSALLGKKTEKSNNDLYMENYLKNNIDSLCSELDEPFSKKELLGCVKNLKNNKASAFDLINNEMLKLSIETMHGPLVLLFNTILKFNLYPSEWKNDLLGPLHKSGDKSDPNNFRGIAVSSCLGKLFNTLLRNRLERKCSSQTQLSVEQISGKVGARTADHILVFHHILNKYVKNSNISVYACYFDLRKAYDTVNRVQLFYNLMVQYKIGGQFLKILQNLYTNNKMFIKLDQGLTKPFITTAGVKQGCSISPFIFNLFIDKLPTIYDESCDAVVLGERNLNCLMWADDCVVFSLSQKGLQNAINRTVNFFTSHGLSINSKKTQCMIFNKRGLRPKLFPSVKFYINGQLLENAETYTYLGLVFVPSGSPIAASKELYLKASRTWFSLSHVIYENKKMPVRRALQLVDSLVTPVAMYSAEVLAILSLPKNSFTSKESLLKAWEAYFPEKINQRACRMVLSVHKKTSRLAVLGELGRYPMLIKSLIQVLKYDWQIAHKVSNNSLVKIAYNEMLEGPDNDSWLSRVQHIKTLFNLQPIPGYVSAGSVANQIKSKLHSIFDRFWLDQINQINLGSDNLDHNKLRFYKTLKNCFKTEPYIDLVQNRNQRSNLTRVRTSAHSLEVEVLRYKVPPVPYCERYCRYCTMQVPGDETHFLMFCDNFRNQRQCFIGKLKALNPSVFNFNATVN